METHYLMLDFSLSLNPRLCQWAMLEAAQGKIQYFFNLQNTF